MIAWAGISYGMVQAGIYCIQINRSPRLPAYYLGQSASLTERRNQHLRALRAGRHDNVRLQRAFTKYGETAILFRVLLVCAPTKETLTVYEQAILNLYRDTHGERRILNVMLECVSSHLGVKRRPESIAKLSAALRGKKRTPEQNAANAARRVGTTVSTETREKISASHKARPRHPNSLAALQAAQNSPIRLEKLRSALGGKPKVHSEATKQKIAATLRGRKQSKELIEKRISPLRGRKKNPEATTNG